MAHVRNLKDLWRFLPALAIMAIIFYLSSQPASALPHFGPLDLPLKKAGHMIAYGLLGLAYDFGLAIAPSLRRRRVLALLLATLFAMSDELHQSFVPGRNAWWGDVMIDGLGAALAIYLVARYSNSSSNSTS
ncbi:MAG: VanZ family protein [Anaerolineales bacterium]|jgi:VanZ family protein